MRNTAIQPHSFESHNLSDLARRSSDQGSSQQFWKSNTRYIRLASCLEIGSKEYAAVSTTAPPVRGRQFSVIMFDYSQVVVVVCLFFSKESLQKQCLHLSYALSLQFLGIITYFCPCYIIGKNAEAVGDSCCICAMAHFFWPINLWARVHVRGKIREQKGIAVSCARCRAVLGQVLYFCVCFLYSQGSCIADCCLVYWCYWCTICQEAQVCCPRSAVFVNSLYYAFLDLAGNEGPQRSSYCKRISIPQPKC